MGLAQILHEEFNIFSTQTHSFCKTHPYCVWGMTDVKRSKLYTYIGNLNDQKPDSTSITTRQEVLPHQTFLWERGAWSWEIAKSLHLSRAYQGSILALKIDTSKKDRKETVGSNFLHLCLYLSFLACLFSIKNWPSGSILDADYSKKADKSIWD